MTPVYASLQDYLLKIRQTAECFVEYLDQTFNLLQVDAGQLQEVSNGLYSAASHRFYSSP